MRTPFPWAQSDNQPKLVFFDNLGLVDFKRPVAKFHHAEDARSVIDLLRMREEILATLRSNLTVLEEELKSRRLSCVPEYIEPIKTAVERTRATIALAEGWT